MTLPPNETLGSTAAPEAAELLELCNELMAGIDADGRLRFVNSAWVRVLGTAREASVGQPFLDFVQEDSRASAKSALDAVRRGQAVRRLELSMRGPFGTRVVLEGDLRPRAGSGGERLALAFLHDVTLQRAAEADRTWKTAFLDSVVDGAPEAIMFLGTDGRVQRINPEFTRLFGYEPDEAVGRHIDALVVPADLRVQGADLCVRAGKSEVINIDTVRRCKDGSLVEVSLLATPIRVRGEQVSILGIYRDISERRRLQKRLASAQRLEAVGRLAGGIAHDFNNLLTVIQATTELLAGELPEGSSTRRSAEEIGRAGARAAALTAQLLAFSRRQVVQPVALDLNAVVRDVVRMLERVIGEDVRVDLALADGLGPLLGDASELEQVIMNLTLNARDAMRTGGTLSISTRAQRLVAERASALHVPEGEYLELCVADTGCGMDAATLERIFEPFFSTKSMGGGGTGLGLATVYGIVQRSRGSIQVESEPGKGARFHIYLPVTHARESAPAPQSAPVSRRGAEERVLVVEDDASIRRLVERALGNAGYRVIAAANPEEALELFEQRAEEIALVFTDVVMPGMNGPELVRRIRAVAPSTRVLFTSGYADDRHIDAHGLPKDARFLPKPYSFAALTRSIRETLDA
ncbi:MAG: PAS domain S-box protein [Planctomycetota bacterium]